VRSQAVLSTRAWVDAEHCFAVLDACDAPAVYERMLAAPPTEAVCLYRETADASLDMVAPWLVRVDAAMFAWITQTLWAEPFGILVRSGGSLEELRFHFRRFLRVRSPEGEAWMFRFYDPRVLPSFLEGCTPEQLSDFFGPVEAFGVVDAENYGGKELVLERH